MKIEEALGLAAQAWTTKKNEHKTMDPDLAEAMAQILMKEYNFLGDQISALAEFILGLDCGYPNVEHSAIECAIQMIKDYKGKAELFEGSR